MDETNPQAFPSDYYGHMGMTLRDWFAGQALAGLTANSGYLVAADSLGDASDYVVRSAYEFADAMLAHRTKGTPDAN